MFWNHVCTLLVSVSSTQRWSFYYCNNVSLPYLTFQTLVENTLLRCSSGEHYQHCSALMPNILPGWYLFPAFCSCATSIAFCPLKNILSFSLIAYYNFITIAFLTHLQSHILFWCRYCSKSPNARLDATTNLILFFESTPLTRLSSIDDTFILSFALQCSIRSQFGTFPPSLECTKVKAELPLNLWYSLPFHFQLLVILLCF